MATSTILSDNGVSSGTSGIKTSGGNDGTLVLQTTTAGGAATTALTIDTSQNTTLAGTLAHPLGSAGSPSITFTGDTNTGIYSPGADQVSITTGGTQRVAVDASGNVGVGVTPSAWQSTYGKALQIGPRAASIFSPSTSWTSGVSLYLFNNSYIASDATYKYIESKPATFVNLGQDTFYVSSAASGTAGNTITWTQTLSVGKGTSLALEGATSQTGTGITFPATQSASTDANTLDDYEEGTWTPVIDSATPGTGRSTTVYSAKYTKVGNMVTIHTYIKMATLGTGGAGVIKVSGLPFVVAAANHYGGISLPYSTSLNGNLVFIGAYAESNTSNIVITGQAAAGTAFDSITFATYVKANTEFIIGGSYFTS